MIWFTGDEHYSHGKIIDFVKRPFRDSSEMDNILMKNHNNLVQNEDTVFHIGDFSLRGPENKFWFRKALEKLNGNHHLILGNHDQLNPFMYIECGFISVHTSLKFEEFILVHDPSASCIDRTTVFLCGHIHDLFKTQKNVVNVGVDVWDYKPVSIDDIRKITKDTSFLMFLEQATKIVKTWPQWKQNIFNGDKKEN